MRVIWVVEVSDANKQLHWAVITCMSRGVCIRCVPGVRGGTAVHSLSSSDVLKAPVELTGKQTRQETGMLRPQCVTKLS